jgi:hypothetical protein
MRLSRPSRQSPSSGRQLLLRKPRTLCFLLLSATLGACASPPPIRVTEAPPPASLACGQFPRPTFDRLHDTLPTIAVIKAIDAWRDQTCGAGK